MKAGIYSRNAYDSTTRTYAFALVYQFEEQLKEGGVKLSKRIRNEYAEMVQQAAAKAVYDRKFLPRGESEEFGDVVSGSFLATMKR